MTEPTVDSPTLPEPEDGLGDLYPVESVRTLFTTLGKALRAFQLYDRNNPIYQRFVTALAEAFTGLWTELAELTVAVQEERFLYEGVDVYHAPNRSDSLAFMLYREGIRELTFVPGVEREVERILGVLRRGRGARSADDDLLTLLWEAELQYLKYFYVDLLAEGDGVALPGAGEPPSATELQGVLEGELQEGRPPRVEDAPVQMVDIVNSEDFNPTLYALDASEMEALRTEIDAEERRDVRGAVIGALLDRLEEPENPGRQSEILHILAQLLPTLLSRGALTEGAELLAELEALESRPDTLAGERATELTALLDQVSSGPTMEELVRALEDRAIEPSAEELGSFLARLRAGALAPLLRATEGSIDKELRPVLQKALEGIAKQNLRDLVGLVSHSDAAVVAGAVRLAARLGVDAVAPALGDLLAHPDPNVRLAAVDAALDLRASTGAEGLVVALDDREREVRLAAARALASLEYTPAAGRLRDILQSRELREADLTEKITFFESYGSLAESGAVPFLDKLLNGRGFLRRRESSELRACAALALGKVGTEESVRALEVAARRDDPVVRSAVKRALRGQEED